jgi:RibD C-terminal domain
MSDRPFILWKCAASLDGRIAAADGSSKWITSAEARAVDDQGIHRVVDQGIRHPALVSSSLLGLLVSRWSGGCRAACGVGSCCLP